MRFREMFAMFVFKEWVMESAFKVNNLTSLSTNQHIKAQKLLFLTIMFFSIFVWLASHSEVVPLCMCSHTIQMQVSLVPKGHASLTILKLSLGFLLFHC